MSETTLWKWLTLCVSVVLFSHVHASSDIGIALAFLLLSGFAVLIDLARALLDHARKPPPKP